MRVESNYGRHIARPLIMAVSCAWLALAPGAQAQQPASTPPAFSPPNLTPAGVRSLAATCAACHGTNGRSVGGAIPGLAGLDKEYFVSQMKAFREGRREATLMHQLAKGYSEAETGALGDFFAAQKK